MMTEKEFLKKRIERLKQELSDYIRLSKSLKMEESEIQKRIDLYLDDLSKSLKKLEE